MKYKVIINACSPFYKARSEEIAFFLKEHELVFDSVSETNEAIIFYVDERKSEDIKTCLPFRTFKMVRIKNYQPEIILNILHEFEIGNPAETYIFPGDYSGNELAARFAWRLNGSSLVALEKISKQDDKLIGVKKVYSGNLQGSFFLRKKPYCFSLARGMSRLKADMPSGKKRISFHDYRSEAYSLKPENYLESPIENENKLEKASFIIAVGRGASSSQEISRLQKISQELGAEFGVSRPVVMNAWASLDRLIGASGAVTSPDVCLTLAISGSPPFYYGIEKSKKIIAVNHDGHAPILKAADLVIIDDYKKVFNTLYKLVSDERNV